MVRSRLSRPLALRRRRRTTRQYRQRPNAATGFPAPSRRGPPPANRRDRRPARNAQPGRNARIAPLERGDRHRRGRRPGHRQRPNTAAGFPTPSPRGPSPASRRDRRPARNIQLERNARIAQLERGDRHRRGRRYRRGHQPGHRQRPNAAAGFSQAVAARAAAREPSRPTPRAGHPARAQCAHCAARARRLQLSRPPARSPPAPECRRWFFHAAAARAAAREPSRPSPRAESPARAQCTIARLNVGRRYRRGARPGHRRRSNTTTDFPAQSPRWAGPLLRARAGPSRNTQPGAPLALRTITDGGRHRRGPNPGTAPPPPQRSRSSLLPRTVAPSIKSAHRGRFPT